jgi:hypothetical protein
MLTDLYKTGSKLDENHPIQHSMCDTILISYLITFSHLSPFWVSRKFNLGLQVSQFSEFFYGFLSYTTNKKPKCLITGYASDIELLCHGRMK